MYRKPIASRGFAFFIDMIIILIIGLILNRLVGFGTLTINQNTYNFNMNWLESTFLAIVYFGLLESLWEGKTVGKYLLKLEVLNEDMSKPDKQKLAIRAVLKSVLLYGFIISWIVMLVSEKKQALHDLFTHTIVVKKINNNEIITQKNPEDVSQMDFNQDKE